VQEVTVTLQRWREVYCFGLSIRTCTRYSFLAENIVLLLKRQKILTLSPHTKQMDTFRALISLTTQLQACYQMMSSGEYTFILCLYVLKPSENRWLLHCKVLNWIGASLGVIVKETFWTFQKLDCGCGAHSASLYLLSCIVSLMS
jgi:hypothetical protein